MYGTPPIENFYDQTVLHPIGLIAVVMLGLALLGVPRRYALAPMLVLACFVSPAQRVVVAGFDFNLLRIMVLFGWARVLLRSEWRGLTARPIDVVIVLWTIAGTVTLSLLDGEVSALIYRLGLSFDALGMYFLFRVLVRNWEDAARIARTAALLSFPVVAVFLFESATGRNMFSIFGGVSPVTMLREGRLRCQGPFAHPILAGCFWAGLLPLIAAMWWDRRPWRWLAPVGLLNAIIIVGTTASSTPISSAAIAGLAFALLPLRRFMPWMRIAGVLGLIGLQLAMVSPLWAIIARFNVVGGSTGWYRYKLIDVFIEHFDEWWVLGSNDYEGWWFAGLSDVTNEYVLQGLRGGLVTLGLFIAIIALAFHGVGRMRAPIEPLRLPRAMAWAFGVGLVVHCSSFIGVAYFGQVVMLWYLTLAAIASLAPTVRRARPVAARPLPLPRLIPA